MIVQKTKDGKNGSVRVAGIITPGSLGPRVVLDLDQFTPPTAGWKGIRLDSAVWLLQEKLGIHLWWEDPTKVSLDKRDSILIFPMESRNFLRLEEGISSPRISDGWGKKIWMTAFNCDSAKSAMFILDFDKQ